MNRLLNLIGVACCLALASCGAEKPRSLEEISKEQTELPALFLTESGKRVIAPGNQGVVIHEKSREVAFPAFVCGNPDCPGRSGDDPYLFCMPDPRFYVDDDGEIGSREFDNPDTWEFEGSMELVCPKCAEVRQRSQETRERADQYLKWCQPYELPESAKRREELEREYQARVDYINQRIGKTE
jgi:hypothetical protein